MKKLLLLASVLLFIGCVEPLDPIDDPDNPDKGNDMNMPVNWLIPNNRTTSELRQDVRAVYDDYKRRFLESTPSGNHYILARGTGGDGALCATQSEAHGYGMIIFALANWDPDAKKIFDGMNQLRKAQPSTGNPALMSWVVFPEHVNNTDPAETPGGSWELPPPRRRSNATDGDLDMAYALLLAHKRWGYRPNQTYLDDAKKIIAAIKESNMHSPTHRTNVGDWSAWRNDGCTRPSDWMPGHFRAFAKATGDNFWNRAADTIYALFEQFEAHNSNTGLVSDFAIGSPIRPDPNGCFANEVPNFIHYSYNACRVPWRIATDWIHNDVLRAEAQINKISTWLRGATNESPAAIRDGYRLNGTPLGSNTAGMPFVAPFAVGMVADRANQQFLNNTWNVLRNNRDNSYGAAIQLLCMLLITGQWGAPN